MRCYVRPMNSLEGKMNKIIITLIALTAINAQASMCRGEKIVSCDQFCLYETSDGVQANIDGQLISDVSYRQRGSTIKFNHTYITGVDNNFINGTIDLTNGVGVITDKQSGWSPYDGFSSYSEEYELSNCSI